jgi:hypothetical protein
MPIPVQDQMWQEVLAGQKLKTWRSGRRLLGRIPADDRCKNCNAPLTGPGAILMRIVGRAPYKRNPKFCNY